MPLCLLVRHGRTTSNVEGTLAGWSDGVALDETGRAQVQALAARMEGLPVVRLVSSPLQRCRETAELLCHALGDVELTVDDALGECWYGGWTGRKLAELAKEPLWRTVQDQPSAARFPPSEDYPAESIAEMALRAVTAVRRHDAAVATEHGAHALWVGVSHGDVLKAVVSDAAGAHLDEFQRIAIDPASLSVLRYTERRPFVLRVNDSSSSLRDLVPAPQESRGTDAEGADGHSAGTAGAAGAAASKDVPAGVEEAQEGVPTGDAPVGGGAGPSAYGN